MWIVTKDGGFVSLVQHSEDPNFVRARARRREHLVATFQLEDHEVIDFGDNAPDYRWHANVDRQRAAEAVFYAVHDIDYESHCKEEFAPPSDNVFYGALMACWTALYRLQDPSRPIWGQRAWQDDDMAFDNVAPLGDDDIFPKWDDDVPYPEWDDDDDFAVAAEMAAQAAS